MILNMTKEQILKEIDEMEKRLRRLKEEVTTMKSMDTIQTRGNVSRTMSCEMEQAVINNLHELGILANLDGYRYLKTAVELLIEGEVASDFYITKELYPKIAEVYQKTSKKVERAIRHAIYVGYNKDVNLKLWRTIFGQSVSDRKPTNAEFITTFVEYIVAM